MQGSLQPFLIRPESDCPEFPLLEDAMRRHMLWADEHRALGELDDASDLLADARAIRSELCLSN